MDAPLNSSASNESNAQRIERDMRDNRKRALAHHIIRALKDTLIIRAISIDTNCDDVRVDYSDRSLEVIAPLIEAIDILEAIIWASDGCMGHRQCVHSMEPWQRARALLALKWEAETDPDVEWPNTDKERRPRKWIPSLNSPR